MELNADIHTLYESDFYKILDFKCRCIDCKTSKPEHSDNFSISFVRKGNFYFNTFRHSFDSYTGCILVTKPEYERTVTHAHSVPDECTIIEFNSDFYKELLIQYESILFLFNNDLHSALVKTSPETEFLHYCLVSQICSKEAVKLEIDQLVLEIIEKAFSGITDYQPDKRIDARLKTGHLLTIEKAKSYIAENFKNDLSLKEVADYCHISPFHFSRIFKLFTGYSPHQFLLITRLKNAELLLRNTSMQFGHIAFDSGFNSIEHFTTAFRLNYKMPPGKYKSLKTSCPKT